MVKVDRLLRDVAADMTRRADDRGGPDRLRERADLEPAFVGALQTQFGDRAQKDRKVIVPGWSRIGRVDAIVRAEAGSGALELAVELKWAAAGQLYEAIWDLFKMALVAGRSDVEWAGLATGAPVEAWATDACRDLLSDGVHDTAELCKRRFDDRRKRLMWDDALAGGYDSFPEAVPASIRTEHVGCTAIRSSGQAWELRMVRVTAETSKSLKFRDGWPGRRPRDAAHPLPPPA
jgi:hypothetical protein